MGSSFSKGDALRAFQTGELSGADLAALQTRYRVHNGYLQASDALRLLRDLRDMKRHLYDQKQWNDTITEAENWVHNYGSESVSLDVLLSQIASLDLTESATHKMYPIDVVDTQGKIVRDYGKEVSLQMLKANAPSKNEARKGLLEFSPTTLTQSASPITWLPKDVLIGILAELSLKDINRVSRTCKKLFVAAREILLRSKPPRVFCFFFPGDPNELDLDMSSCFGFDRRTIFKFSFDQTRQSLACSVDGALPEIFMPFECSDDGIVRILQPMCLSSDVLVVRLEKVGARSFSYSRFHDLAVLNLKEKTLSLIPNKVVETVYLHERLDGSRFVFAFDEGNAGVIEIRERSAGDPSDAPRIIVESKATTPRLDVHTDFVKTDRSNMYAFTGKKGDAEWLNMLVEYNPITRTWSSREMSGYLPTRSNMHLKALNNTCIMASTSVAGSFSGGLFFCNTQMCFWSHVSIGSLNFFRPIQSKKFDILVNALVTREAVIFVNSIDWDIVEQLVPESKRIVEGVPTDTSSFILNKLSKNLFLKMLKSEGGAK